MIPEAPCLEWRAVHQRRRDGGRGGNPISIEESSGQQIQNQTDYFEGEGHSLKATKSEPARPSRPSGFRREESNSRSVATLPESRIYTKGQRGALQGKRAQAVLEIRCLFDYPVYRLLGKPEYSTHSFNSMALIRFASSLSATLASQAPGEWRLSF